MANEIEPMPTTKLRPNDESGTVYVQPTDMVVEVGNSTELALVTKIENMEGGTATILIDTAVRNQDGHYVTIAEVASFATTPGFPAMYYTYLGGPSANNTTPGFARYLRVRVAFGSQNDSITLGMKGILKP